MKALVTGETARRRVARGGAIHAGSLNFFGGPNRPGDGGGI